MYCSCFTGNFWKFSFHWNIDNFELERNTNTFISDLKKKVVISLV